MVTGDEATCAEARELLGAGLVTVAVKRGLGRFSARQIAPQRVRRMIEEGAKRALSNLGAVAPFDPGRPCEIEVAFMATEEFDTHRRKAGVEVKGSQTIVSRADDWWSAWKQFYF